MTVPIDSVGNLLTCDICGRIPVATGFDCCNALGLTKNTFDRGDGDWRELLTLLLAMTSGEILDGFGVSVGIRPCGSDIRLDTNEPAFCSMCAGVFCGDLDKRSDGVPNFDNNSDEFDNDCTRVFLTNTDCD